MNTQKDIPEIFNRPDLEAINRYITAGGDPHVKDALGCNLILFVLFNMRESMQKVANTIELLLKGGVNPNEPASSGFYPLHIMAARHDANPQIISKLLQGRADPNVQDQFGQTPLMWSIVMRGNSSIIQLLLDNNADVNLCDNQGQTALMYAKAFHNPANPNDRYATIIKILESHYADASIKNIHGHTAEDIGNKPTLLQIQKSFFEQLQDLEEVGQLVRNPDTRRLNLLRDMALQAADTYAAKAVKQITSAPPKYRN